MNTKTRPSLGVFWCSTRGEEEGDAPDTKTCPTRACFGVRHEGKEWGHIGHRNAPHKGAFRCSRRGEEEGDAPDTKTCPTRACFGVRHEGKGWGRIGHQNAPHKGAFRCSRRGEEDAKERPGTFWCLACWKRARLGRERFVGEKGGGEARTARLRLCWVEVSKRKLIKNSGRTLYAHPTPPSVSPGLPMWSIVGGGAFVANEGDGG